MIILDCLLEWQVFMGKAGGQVHEIRERCEQQETWMLKMKWEADDVYCRVLEKLVQGR